MTISLASCRAGYPASLYSDILLRDIRYRLDAGQARLAGRPDHGRMTAARFPMTPGPDDAHLAFGFAGRVPLPVIGVAWRMLSSFALRCRMRRSRISA